MLPSFLHIRLTSHFETIFNSALHAYKKRSRQDLISHPLLTRFQSCDSANAVLTVLESKCFAATLIKYKASDSFPIESRLPCFMAHVHLLLVTQIMPVRIPLPGFISHTTQVSLALTSTPLPPFHNFHSSKTLCPTGPSERHSFQTSTLFLGGGHRREYFFIRVVVIKNRHPPLLHLHYSGVPFNE